MKKSSIVKATFCGGVALAIVATVGGPKISSATLNAEKGLAGISITLDKYCSDDTTATTDTVTNGAVTNTEYSSSSIVTVASPSAVSGAALSGAAVTEMLEDSSKYANTAISVASEYVNIRKKKSTDSKVIGKLYRGAAATVLSNDGEWVKVQSGSCTGYVSASLLAIGDRAEKVADAYGTKKAKVTTTTLKVREKANTTSDCLTMIPEGESYSVVSENDEWVKISIDGEDIKGYVSKDYVDVDYEFEHAISIQEEKEKLRKEKEAEEAAKAEEEARRAAQNSASNSSSSSNSTTSTSSSSTSNSSSRSSSTSSSSKRSSSSSKTSSSSTSSSTKSSGSGSAVVNYALQFVGNPYVWGGTSLTNGADCSGFVMSVYAHFGVSLPHSSASQAGYGRKVSLSEAQPGDLVFYARGGSVNHVGIYIGGGRIVNAACKREGICTKSVSYRSVYCVKRILN